ncbi:L-ribulose-5-phosphate 4-epimerase [Leuconostoc mesenteroides]|jgi:L-ribulose-5-phosphate 4-epimerase|uniref:L-ribulose-5-phosphate 4-epimerase n=1 Tax=Leuconostoc mesenteroides subsp. mesenteroides (strain ATCC 8293 / DSM 20343 / BCRC 11652 / CCM 1803 / JCM 6124 / NCDO 523 / NBRC 100496 / NCIMB 8023 / NCTC 12954 / NRRL B-1118 / 37Y) TaxID=203120 RepID=Q03XV9_LEUMM|nr:L-ribulose-5-phosphate 4-epimerase [Leuconostoc mesenteroides]ABJ61963.1 L-ribulose 5-phosphate 4-epimerase [Leuconostoc mesenteroides subsp. mesenteroides ATCC 8293]ARN63306.1 L-ribulose-5-phosphate 4-epimerase [Leuconostoc mesenteroides subsp. mesenteroides]MBD9366554.1 L-ribulose-5-phosphate 4-epimerase [Leuconostoc mesenteroides]MCJ2159598.1 L-ribulose-5-phosphate 4-epimerase [Leuconostoc mesenteroides]MCM6835258.1 L-ribulose-5-phosphate 4-epimerase [Leuconostoc mesenteroides]
MLEDLKKEVYEANMALPANNLVTLTWGNVSQVDREKGVFVIKPSGVDYNDLKPEDMVVVSLDGHVVEGNLNPSTDTPTHAFLYRHWTDLGGIVHTHSKWAVAFAQAGIPVPAAGTTHADTFYGDVPVARRLTKNEVDSEYELNTGKSIVRAFESEDIDPMAVPGVLTNDHGPFTWGKDAMDAVHNAIVLDVVAEIDYHTMSLNPSQDIHVPQYLLDRHYYRKHGVNAYYGQNTH